MATDGFQSAAWVSRTSPIDRSSMQSFEPHVPLRKASPHLLQSRSKAGPHPLLYTGAHAGDIAAPSSSPNASPVFTHATASHARPSFDMHVSPRDVLRKNSAAAITAALARQAGADTDWLRHDASQEKENSASHGLKASKSVSEGMRGLRERRGWQNSDIDTPKSDESAWEIVSREQTSSPQEALARTDSTANSDYSYKDSWASTDRSSRLTALSSNSDFVRIHPGSPTPIDESFSVEDAIGMYADGFASPERLSVARNRSPSASGRPSTSPAPRKRPNHLHQRSQSVIVTSSMSGFQFGFDDIDQPAIAELEAPLPHGVSLELSGSEHTAADRTFEDPRPPPPLPSPLQSPDKIRVHRDRHGFKKVSHHVSLAEFDAWEGPYNKYLEGRQLKWDAIMMAYGLSTVNPTRFPPKSDKIKRYVRAGIPPAWRGAAWFWYAGGPGLQKQYEGLYYSLLIKIKNGDALQETDREHIERDLNRTFPDNATFKPDSARSSSTSTSGPETPIISSLRRVLQAFAIHRPDIGYCQSLNFIAGMLLLFLDLDEEKSFLLLTVITTDYLPGTHGISLEGANIDIAVLMASVKESLPAVWTQLDDRRTPTSVPSTPISPSVPIPTSLPTVSLATTPWFLTLFLTTLPTESALRVWDVLFLEGSKTLFRAALAIFKLAEPDIRAATDPMEVFQIVQTFPRKLLDANALMDLCFRKKRGQGFGGLSQDTVERRREEGRRRRAAATAKEGGGAIPPQKARAGTEEPPGSAGGMFRADSAKSTATSGGGVVIRGRFRSRTKGAAEMKT